MVKAVGRRPGQARSYVVALVGADLGTTLTPALHEREADLLGLRYVYQTVDIDALELPSGRLAEILAAARWLGLAGLNVTHPCKQLILPLLDDLSPEAAAIGAVNTVVLDDSRAVGHNTDWTGFATSLKHGLPGAQLDRVVLLGAGGAGSAVGYALLTLGAGNLAITDVRTERATTLARALGQQFEAGRVEALAAEDVADRMSIANGIVNATPTGMSGRPGMPVPAELLRPDLWIADIVYRPMTTPLLATARTRGCRTLAGGAMAVYQAAHAFRLFTGVTPDQKRMLAHLEELLSDSGGEG